MTISSRWQVPVPRCSLQQWIFGSACGPVPDRQAFIDPENPETNYLTISDYRLLAKRVALGLLKAGLRKGDRVLVFSGNSLVFPSVFLGVLMAGGIVTGANPTFVPRELAYQLKDSEASFLLVAKPSVKTAFEAAAEVGLPRDRIYVLENDGTPPAPELAQSPHPGPGAKGRVDGAHHWTELLAGNGAEAERWSWDEPADPEQTTCCLNYSSGTTGVPKGVEISHHAYVANGVGVTHLSRLRPDFEERLPRERVLAFLPLYHAYGQTYFIANLPVSSDPSCFALLLLEAIVFLSPSFALPRVSHKTTSTTHHKTVN
jgi:acyl-CoA synthetase (AMP-forming)/AMP-acid ligase II